MKLTKEQIFNYLNILDTPGNVLNVYYKGVYHHSIIKVDNLYHSIGKRHLHNRTAVCNRPKMFKGMSLIKISIIKPYIKDKSFKPFKY